LPDATKLGLDAAPDGALRAKPSLPAEVSFVELAGIRHRGQRYALRASANAYELRPESSRAHESA
jgi:hypothetical protein